MANIRKYIPRKISDKRAEQEIVKYLRKHLNKDAYDVAMALKLEPVRVINICNRLAKEGRLEIAADKNI